MLRWVEGSRNSCQADISLRLVEYETEGFVPVVEIHVRIDEVHVQHDLNTPVGHLECESCGCSLPTRSFILCT